MSLFDRRFVIFAGKGGVGRTTVAAAFAKAAVRRKKRVLLCQTKSKERLSTLFDSRPVGTEIVRIEPDLDAVNMTPEMALREYGTMMLRSQFVAKQVLENRFARAFLHAVPGLEDYAMLGKPWYHTTELVEGRPRWDIVILDGPATGHLLSMLSIPRSIIEAVGESPLTESAREADAMLRDPARTSMVLVTLPEELPTQETIELAAQARSNIGVQLGPLVINRVLTPRFEKREARKALRARPTSQDPALLAMLSAASDHATRTDTQARNIETLTSTLRLPDARLPELFTPSFGPRELATLADQLDAQLSAQVSRA